MISSAAIVGCGPSGMVIAHACHQMGMPFIIYAPKKPSFISGAQYLHTDIDVRADGISPKTVHYTFKGTEHHYEKKIYGRLPNGLETSWAKFNGDVEAWPLIDIYHWLWDQYAHRITGDWVTKEWMKELAADGSVIVFNTAPLKKLFPDASSFCSERVQIVNGICFAPQETIVYNGEPGVPWYRSSNLWGHMSIEYPEAAKIPPAIAQYGRVLVEKPLYAKVDIPGVILSGRYGRWEKGVLVDESYHQAIAEIKSRLHSTE